MLAGFIGNCVIDYAKAYGVPVVLKSAFIDGGFSKTSEKGIIALINDIAEGDCDKISQTISSATPWYLSPLAASLILLVISILVVCKVNRTLRPMRGFYTAFYGVIAIVGTILTYLAFSDHYATSPNWLLLWLNPFAIIPAILIWNKRLEPIADGILLVRLFPTLILTVIWPWIISDLLLTLARMGRTEELLKTPRCRFLEQKKRRLDKEKRNRKRQERISWYTTVTKGYTYEIQDGNPHNSTEI